MPTLVTGVTTEHVSEAMDWADRLQPDVTVGCVTGRVEWEVLSGL